MTYYDISFIKNFRGRLVITVHDMIPELFPQYFVSSAAIHPNKRELCERADAIICVSHHTKTDLARLFGISAEKMWVIYLGISPGWGTRRRVVPVPPQFILFVGDRTPYKNFDQVVDAMSRLSIRHRNLHLVCVGTAPFSRQERELLERQQMSDRTHQMALTDEELAYCYSKAAAFVFPSLYEGFGLPTLEAFACGCPVILSNRSCFPEVAGDAALYFDPAAPASLDEAIDRVLGDEAVRKQLIERGTRRVSVFTWERTAIETSRIYRQLVQ